MDEDSDLPAPLREPSRGPVVPWPWLTSILSVVTLTALGTLVVVVSLKDVDVLATVALALAVLSFAAQLIVTMLQGQHASQLHSSTEAALAEVRATTSSLLTNQRDQFDKVLGAALHQAIPAAVQDVTGDEEDRDSDDSDQPNQLAELEERLTVRLQEALNVKPPSITPTRLAVKPSRDPSFERLLETLPDRADGERVATILRSLPPSAIARFGSLAAKVRDRGDYEAGIRYVRRSPEPPKAAKALLDAGLITATESDPSGSISRVSYRLTDDGVTAMRLLQAKGDRPDWADV